jgi:cytochrome c553
MNKKILASVLLSVCAFSATAGDAAAGKVKAAMCAACHGATGISSIPMYPNLAGQKEMYLVKQMKAFKTGTRKDPVMGAMAVGLSDADMENLSAFYAGQK